MPGHWRLHVLRDIVQFLVPEQDLDQADVDLLLEQVRGKGMAQGVH